MKMSKTMKKIVLAVIGVLFVCSLFFVVSPYIKAYIIQNKSDSLLSDLSAADLADNEGRSVSGNTTDTDTVVPPDFFDASSVDSSKAKKNVIGEIKIPRVSVNIPILKGTTTENLYLGATTLYPERKMGKGNFVLFGHHMKDKKILFGPTLKMKKGDIVYITNKKKIYMYKIDSIKTVNEKQVDVVAQTKGNRVTLVTCDTPDPGTDKRVIISGGLVKVSNAK